MTAITDPIFSSPKLASIYDAFDPVRDDLLTYLAIARELKAESVLDIGCGTGSFACLLSEEGFEVTGVDPAQASIEIALKKPFADKVNWICGDTGMLGNVAVDLAVMTGNVSQVFVGDEDWDRNLNDIREAITPNGHFVFETRDPAQRAWEGWTPERTRSRRDLGVIGWVEGYCAVDHVKDDLVKFTWTYHFEKTGETLKSQSTIRFRSKAEITRSLHSAGFTVKEIRDAPDRPGQEFVFIAQRVPAS